MTSDEAIERVAQTAAAAMDGYSEGASHIEDYRIIAHALHSAGLLRAEYPAGAFQFSHYQATDAGVIHTITHQWLDTTNGEPA